MLQSGRRVDGLNVDQRLHPALQLDERIGGIERLACCLEGDAAEIGAEADRCDLEGASACTSSSEPGYDTTCRVESVTIGGAPSDRFDLVTVQPDGSTVARLIFDEGGAVPNRAISYYHDADGRLVVEALDDGANGDIEARLDADEALTSDITPLVVDTNLRDGQVDALQLSIALPTSMIGPWNPARLFYTIPCDQGRAETREINAQRVEVDMFDDDPEDEDGVPEATLTLDRTPEGAVQGWAVDIESDGSLDDIATVTYADDGLVTRVEWARPNEVLGDVYAIAQFVYDTDGNLFAYLADSDGDGETDHEIRYSAGCFAAPTDTTGGCDAFLADSSLRLSRGRRPGLPRRLR